MRTLTRPRVTRSKCWATPAWTVEWPVRGTVDGTPLIESQHFDTWWAAYFYARAIADLYPYEVST